MDNITTYNKSIPAIPENKNWEGIIILVVEDSPTQALLLEKLLIQKGCIVKIAGNGLAAIEAIKKQLPDVVITDIVMPEMNGYDLCYQIKNTPEWKHIPVMLLTSLFDPVDVIRGIECGADNFLIKPYPKDLLFFHIDNILENRKIRHESNTVGRLNFFFAGQSYNLPMNPVQITDLLLSTYSSAIQRNFELHEANRELTLIKGELMNKNQELISLDEQKNQFLGMAAHDLRNPLGVIQGFSTILCEELKDTADSGSLMMISRIKELSFFMLNLINEFLDISVIESGNIHLELHKKDLKSVLQSNLHLNEHLAEPKKIKLYFHCDEEIPQFAFDAYRIEQVLNNLISNAIKFSSAGARIDITLSKKDNEVVVSVKDQGPGISPEERNRLFKSFEKLSAKGTAGETSTGLGLAIVKKIVSEHKGKVWVDSEIGKGAVFNFSLPIVGES